MSKVIKRFIAGAVCPRCSEMDKLVTYTNDDGTFKECVSCGFEEKQLVQVEQNEMDTRVNQFAALEPEGEDAEQVVKIIAAPK